MSVSKLDTCVPTNMITVVLNISLSSEISPLWWLLYTHGPSQHSMFFCHYILELSFLELHIYKCKYTGLTLDVYLCSLRIIALKCIHVLWVFIHLLWELSNDNSFLLFCWILSCCIDTLKFVYPFTYYAFDFFNLH